MNEKLNQKLFEAIEGMEGADRVRELLAAGASVHAISGDGTPALWWAVAHDEPDAEVVRALLDAGADANAAEGNDPSYTVLAAAQDRGAGEEVLRLLRKAGAHEPADEWKGEPLPPDVICPPVADAAATRELLERVECATPLGVSVLCSCLQRGAGRLSEALRQALVWGPMPGVVRLLLSTGADPNATDAYGRAALHRAVEFHAVEENVRELLMGGADPHARDASGRTPSDLVRLACIGEYRCSAERISDLLLTAEAAYAPHPSPETLAQSLFEALRDERWDDVLTLLAEGAPANAMRSIRYHRQPCNFTALDYALLCRAPEGALRGLLGAGALPTQSTLPLAVDCEHGLVVLRLLLAAGADANGRDQHGRTPLMLAAESGDNLLTYRTLLAAGANPNAQDEEDKTVLHYLLDPCTRVNVSALRLLLDFGAEPNIPSNSGITPLMLAMCHSESYTPLVPILLAAGANPHMKDVMGRTPLHHAWCDFCLGSRYASELDIRALLAAGASPNLSDNFDETPCARMLRKGERRKNILRLLKIL